MNPKQNLALVKSHISEYLNYQNPSLKIKGTNLFECPICHSAKPSCKIYPQFGYKVTCYNSACGELGNIFDIFRKLEPDMAHLDDDGIADYLVHVLDIKENVEIDKLLEQYYNSGFHLIPLCAYDPSKSKEENAKLMKSPIQGESWKKNTCHDIRKWREWVEAGLGLGLVGGKISNVLLLDIDTKEIPEDLKPILSDTLIQDTKRGIHLIFEYDADFDNVNHCNFRGKGYEMEIRANNSYIVVAPTKVEDYIRTWNDKKIEKMSPELKKFILDLVAKDVKTEITDSDKEIKDAIDNEDFGIKNGLKGLDGECNDAWIKIGGVLRKKMSVSQVEWALQTFNKLLEHPQQKKVIKAMTYQLSKYDNFDKKELAKEILEHLQLESVRLANTLDLTKSLGYERKDIEHSLDYLVKEQKVIRIGKHFKALNKIEWVEDFMDRGESLNITIPFFENYARFRSGALIVIGAKSGRGKCFAKGTEILMFDGSLKKVEEINEKDLLMGVDSQSRQVLKTCIGQDMMYKICPNKGESFIVNSEHILSLKKTGTYEVVNIRLCDYLKQHKTFQIQHKLYQVPIEFPIKKIPIDPYFIGLWLGDGDKNTSRISKPDIEIQEYLQDLAQKYKLTCKNIEKRKNFCPRWALTNTKNLSHQFSLQKILRELNLINNKHIPNIYKINSRENRLQLLAGLLDSDGYLHYGNFEIITKYEQLAKDIKYLARSLGFMVTENIKKIKYNNQIKLYYKLMIIGDCSVIPLKIQRKKASKRKINKNPLITGFKVIPLKKDNYYGFLLNKDHLHLLGNFIVNHNTTLSCNIVKQFVEQGIKPYYISTESGSNFDLTCASLGLKEGDFKLPPFNHYVDGFSMELEDNAITIVDWLHVPDSEYAKTDSMYERLSMQLTKHGGLVIAFAQLKDEDKLYAEEMTKHYASLVAIYHWGKRYNEKTKEYIYDNENTYFQTLKIRDSKVGLQYLKIPMHFNRETKRIILRTGDNQC